MKVAELGKHVSFLSGYAFKSKFFNEDGVGLPVVRIRDVVRGNSETFYSGEYEERYLVSRGDYLIGMDGEFNLAKWQSGRALLNQRVCKIGSISDAVDRHFLGRFLQVALKEIEDATPFVTVKHLSVKTLKKIQIPLPPLAEQKRIAAILDAADALRAKRRESLEQLDTLLQSTFLEMFGDPVTNPMGWEIAAVGDICKQIRGVTYAKSDARNTPQSEYSPILRANNIGESGQLLLEDFVFVPNSKISPQQRIIPNDVVVAASSGSISVVGKTAQVHDEFDGGFGAFCKVLRPHPEVTPRYFGQYFRTKAYRRIVSNLAAGANINNLKNEHLNNLQIPLPPIDLQKRFAAIVESVEQQKAAHRNHLEELDTLFASLQQRAFQGEL